MGKSRKAEMTLEEMLEAMLEMIGWQAELVQSALRRVREQAARRRRGSKAKAGRRR